MVEHTSSPLAPTTSIDHLLTPDQNPEYSAIDENEALDTTASTEYQRTGSRSRFASFTSFDSRPSFLLPQHHQNGPPHSSQVLPPPLMSITNPSRSKWRISAIVIWIAACGFSDGAPGALLPFIEDYYKINYVTVSFIWMALSMGDITLALIAFRLEGLLGKRKMMSYGALFQAVMFALISPGWNFIFVVLGFFIGGMGGAMGASQHNIFLSKFDKASLYLGFYHGGYGIGASFSPLIATKMVEYGIQWSFFYYILFAWSIFNFFNCWKAFEGCDEDMKVFEGNYVSKTETHDNNFDSQVLTRQISIVSDIGTSVFDSGALSIVSTEHPEDINMISVNADKNLQIVLKSITTWLLSCFVLFYQGGEVILGGWIVTFLIDYRGGSKETTGYIASCFWTGLTAGRLFMTPLLDRHVGGKRSVTLLMVGSITCAILTWFITYLPITSFFIFLIGLFVGPMYPLMITVITKIIPAELQFVSLSIVNAVGASGGALFPFLTGLFAQYLGTFIVLPFFVILFSLDGLIWSLLPNPDRTLADNKWWHRIW
ncbi:unnamed protein product [Ambrosiozyma monospora]|uniref:Unnamed protein product n=1 Tax=Ambrosiozyma monospora TaxID=43982 RepID=A0ACB5TA52_AMBMO|nr:unnamed protein product [Ambrosiozyma monospora]